MAVPLQINYGSIDKPNHGHEETATNLTLNDDIDNDTSSFGWNLPCLKSSLLSVSLLSLFYYAAPALLLGGPHSTAASTVVTTTTTAAAAAAMATNQLSSSSNNLKNKQYQPLPLPLDGIRVPDVVTLEGTPPASWYTQQTVDHFDASNTKQTYAQRYYEHGRHFGGPGFPLFVILAGEDELTDMLYPFVWNDLARQYHGYTLAVEHRFYGESQPILWNETVLPTNEQLHRLLSPDQALEDAKQLIQYKRQELGCSLDKSHPDYCPVITIGGSYPGFLAGLMRTRYPNVVDIGYASSAPFLLYDHSSPQPAYFDKITMTAEAAVPGCAAAVKKALYEIQQAVPKLSLVDAATQLGICTTAASTLPSYISDTHTLLQEVSIVLGEKFSEANMGYYPPGPAQDLEQACRLFIDKDNDSSQQPLTSFQKVQAFWNIGSDENDDNNDHQDCLDLHTEMPPGGTVSSADWSGTGGGMAGYAWDYQCCTLVPECSFSDASMFLPRPWTLEWLTQHCQERFEYTPQPQALVGRLEFGNWEGVTRLLLTNGLQDGWAANSILTPPHKDIAVINFGHGAHHSDLNHLGPNDYDTIDFVNGFQEIRDLMGKWLAEV